MVKETGRIYYNPRVSMKDLDAWLTKQVETKNWQAIKFVRDFVTSAVDQHANVLKAIDQALAYAPRDK